MPTLFIAWTIKGFGLPFAGHKDNHSGLMNPTQMSAWRETMGVTEGDEWAPLGGVGGNARPGVEALIEHCRANHIKLIVPTRDGELAWFAKARPALAADGVAVMVPEPDIVDLCLDKLRFARELQARGFPAIPAFETATVRDDAGGYKIIEARK